MKTAVSTVFVGKKRDYNRRFQEMCSHHLVEPVARPRASTRAGAHDVRARQGLAGRRGRLRSRLVPGRPLSPLPLEFGRRRCPMGLVLRRSSESLVPVRGLRDLIRDTAHRARG